jgi:hypothetical protein
MQAPTAAQLLGAWERSAALGSAEREDALLRLALPDDEPAGLPVGERDARLLELRGLLFGGELEGAADCPRCGEPVEYSVPAQTLLAERASPTNGDGLALSAFGYELRLRLPTGDDLAAASSARDLDGARGILLERCLLSAVAAADGRDEAPARLPPEVVAALAARLAEVDALADTRIALTCPGCGRDWTVALEIGAWLWSELESWARRTLFDVHALASAYGWSEAEILALGPRRELYLELVEA